MNEYGRGLEDVGDKPHCKYIYIYVFFILCTYIFVHEHTCIRVSTNQNFQLVSEQVPAREIVLFQIDHGFVAKNIYGKENMKGTCL